MRQRVLQAQILTGRAAGSVLLLPRIDLAPTDLNLQFQFTRRQFPVRLAFGMTVNKSQG